MHRISRILMMSLLLALPATALADTSADSLLGGSAASSTIQTGSPQNDVPQTSSLQPEPDTGSQASTGSANTLQGDTPANQQILEVEGEGQPTPLTSSNAWIWWWAAGLFVLIVLVILSWRAVLKRSRPIRQAAPQPEPAPIEVAATKSPVKRRPPVKKTTAGRPKKKR